MITLKQIRNFIVLAGELHFARAAHKLGISQAALSNDLKKLETAIGCQLIDRSDRWVIRLTEAGSIYLRQMKNIPESVELAEQAARRASRGESGTLSIAVSTLICDFLDLGEVCRNMLKKYPEVKLRVFGRHTSPDVLSLVNSGKCDIGLLFTSNLNSLPETLQYKKLMQVPLALAIPANHPLANKKGLRIQDLRNSHLILPPHEEGPRLRSYFEQFFIKHCNCPPLIAHEAIGVGATLQLVGAGLGIAIIPLPAAEINSKRVVIRRLQFDLERFTLAVWDSSNRSQVLRNFILNSLDDIHFSIPPWEDPE